MMLYSIILNLHREGQYLAATLKSLSEAVIYAAPARFELVVVLDNSDKLTKSIIGNSQLDCFEKIVMNEVTFGAPGLSREYGVKHSSGEFIIFADGDDLVSYNYFKKIIDDMDPQSFNTVYFPEFLCEFGDSYGVAHYSDLNTITPLAFFQDHPFISRVSGYKSIFLKQKYHDIKVGKGYAYEDWHCNCNLIASGIDFKIIQGIVLFYRKHKDSILKKMNENSTRIIPFSNYFEPETYVNLCQEGYKKLHNKNYDYNAQHDYSEKFHKLSVFFDKAKKIEEKIDYKKCDLNKTYDNRYLIRKSSFIYYKLCDIVKNKKYTHIFFVPFFVQGGAEKYILNIINEISDQNQFINILVMSGQSYKGESWEEKFPINVDYIDLSNLCNGLSSNDLCYIAFRLADSTQKDNAKWHFLDSKFTKNFFRLYKNILHEKNIIAYRFSNAYKIKNGKIIPSYSFYDFIKNYFNVINILISDNETVLTADKENSIKDGVVIPNKTYCLYTKTDIIRSVDHLNANSAPRLYWASRIDTEKRPNLIGLIAVELMSILPGYNLNVYGQSFFGYDFNPDALPSNVKFGGGFDGLSSLDVRPFDIFIYTSYFDGLPNILIEALSLGMAVIAPNVGGIAELIKNDDTGILLINQADDKIMAQMYAKSIKQLVTDPTLRENLVTRGQALLQQQHSVSAFSNAVKSIYNQP